MKINLSQWSFTASIAPHGRGRRARARAGFTLIEIMVALAILMLMLAIIFVPLNLGTRFFSIGNSRSHVQQAAQLTVNQIANDLHQAIYVYPNDVLAGVTTNAPYKTGDPIGKPYYQSTSQDQVFNGTTANSIVCDAGSNRVGNSARLDFILPASSSAGGAPTTPLTSAPYLVTYYARRLNVGPTTDPNYAYDANDNPIVLFRAQCPLYYGNMGNIDLSTTRYPPSSSACTTNNSDRYSAWLAQSEYGEPNLQPLAADGNATAVTGSPEVVGNHLQITPRGMGLLAPHALDDPASPTQSKSFIPDTTFFCEDTNGDGKIDRVRINLGLGEFDQNGAISTSQNVHLGETVDLPNIQ